MIYIILKIYVFFIMLLKLNLNEVITQYSCLESKCFCATLAESVLNIECSNQLIEFKSPLKEMITNYETVNQFVIKNGIFETNKMPIGLLSGVVVSEILIENSTINYIDNQSFIGAISVRKLSFRDLNLTKIENESFKYLNLNEIDFVNCNIDDTFMNQNHEAIEQMNKIDQMTMTHNKLTRINNDWFKRLKIMSLLNLSFNRIRKIEADVFKSMPELSRLNLKSNNFSACFDQIPLLYLKLSLARLVLSYNKLTCIPVFDRFIKLKILDLSNNLIESLDYNVFQNLISLNVLNMNNNKLKHICQDCFSKSLLYLRLENNHLNRIPNLKHLNSLILLNMKNQNGYLKHLSDYQFDRINSSLNLKIELDQNDLDEFSFKAFCSKYGSYLDNLTISYQTYVNIINTNKCLLGELTHGSTDYIILNVDKPVEPVMNTCNCDLVNYLKYKHIILNGIECNSSKCELSNFTLYTKICLNEKYYDCQNKASRNSNNLIFYYILTILIYYFYYRLKI